VTRVSDKRISISRTLQCIVTDLQLVRTCYSELPYTVNIKNYTNRGLFYVLAANCRN